IKTSTDAQLGWFSPVKILICNWYKKGKHGSTNSTSADAKAARNNYAKLKVLPNSSGLGYGAKVIPAPLGTIGKISVHQIRVVAAHKDPHPINKRIVTQVTPTCAFHRLHPI